MKKLLYKFCYFIGSIITILIKNKFIHRLFNFTFEHSPFYITKRLVKFIKLPSYDWTIFLANKKKIKTKIYTNNPKTMHFAVAYKSHNVALNFAENIINNYYNKNIPWIDIGANLGLRSLLALSENRTVFFIEPNTEVNNLNIERCKLNSFRNYTLFKLGASNKTAEAEFVIDDSSYSSSLEKEWVNEQNKDRIEKIQLDTVDNLFKKEIENFETAYIKIDVEGHELQVLEGAKNFIQKLAPTMIIEVNSKGKHFQDFLLLMKKHKYEVFEIGYFGFNKYFRYIDKKSFKDMKLKNNDFLNLKDKSLINIIKKHSV